MKVTHKLTVHMDDRRCIPCVDAVQLDANTRVLELTLLCEGVAWEVPSGKTVSVAFRKSDGHSGWYSKLPDGTTACSVSSNVVTAVLAPQVLTAAGKTRVAVVIQDPSTLDQIAAFPVTVDVAPNPAAGQGISEDYFEYKTMAEVNAALEGFRENLDGYDQALETLRQSIGSGLLTSEMIAALDAMFRVVAYIKEDVSAEYAAFRAAFGLEDAGDSGDTGGSGSDGGDSGGGAVEVEWEFGTLTMGGENSDSTKRLRTVGYVPDPVTQITAAGGYLVALACFDASGGVPSGTCYLTIESMSFATSGFPWYSTIDLADVRNHVGDHDHFRVLLKREDDGTMQLDEASNVIFT